MSSLTEPGQASNFRNEEFLKTNFDEIEEDSFEESVMVRESIRYSIESQLALVNKLTEIQVRTSEAQPHMAKSYQEL